ncbi:MAG: hypothetical protein MHM6MM_001052 [Cercozoa sp. M6MM]
MMLKLRYCCVRVRWCPCYMPVFVPVSVSVRVFTYCICVNMVLCVRVCVRHRRVFAHCSSAGVSEARTTLSACSNSSYLVLSLHNSCSHVTIYIYIYIYICVCVCVRVYEDPDPLLDVYDALPTLTVKNVECVFFGYCLSQVEDLAACIVRMARLLAVLSVCPHFVLTSLFRQCPVGDLFLRVYLSTDEPSSHSRLLPALFPKINSAQIERLQRQPDEWVDKPLKPLWNLLGRSVFLSPSEKEFYVMWTLVELSHPVTLQVYL